METMAGMHRSCGCGLVTENDCGKELTLAGWVNTRRDHGGLIFIDLRDRSGIVQLVMSPQYGKKHSTRRKPAAVNSSSLSKARSEKEAKKLSIRR